MAASQGMLPVLTHLPSVAPLLPLLASAAPPLLPPNRPRMPSCRPRPENAFPKAEMGSHGTVLPAPGLPAPGLLEALPAGCAPLPLLVLLSLLLPNVCVKMTGWARPLSKMSLSRRNCSHSTPAGTRGHTGQGVVRCLRAAGC